MPARLARNIASATGREDYIQVRLERRDGALEAVPVFGKSNLIYTLIRADGMLRIPLDIGGLVRGRRRSKSCSSETRCPATCTSKTSRSRTRSSASGPRSAARAACTPLPGERVPSTRPCDRVTAEPVFARISVPHYHAAAMDGIAVRADDTIGASETPPLQLRVGQHAIWVDTGDPLPPDTNAVIMAEHVQELGDECVEIMAPVAPWSTYARWARTSSRPSWCCPKITS